LFSQVAAFDKGLPRQSSTATVLLTVSDVNDNAPRFARLYTLNITENVAVGTQLLVVETVDKDGPGVDIIKLFSFVTDDEAQ
jgi:hypothetical protein